MTYQETLSYIHAVQWAGHKPGLSRTQNLLAALGNPEQKLKFVHVAGTNGKGSTSAMMANCLRCAGYKVGLYTSPYIQRFNERMQINGNQIPDETLVDLVARIRPVAEQMAGIPTEFELITAIGMLYFYEQGCDIVVLEVGLGGTLDSTNVIPCPAVAVIAALGLDHTEQLGSTLAEVAAAKAGIIKAGGSVVSYGGTPEGDAVIAATCARHQAALTQVDFTRLQPKAQTLTGTTFDYAGLVDLQIPLLGQYQPRNAALAITALQILVQKGWRISEEALREGLASVTWAGRFELLQTVPPFVLDGSHNVHGLQATAHSLRDLFPAQKYTFVLGVMADKNVDEMLDILCPLAKRIVTVTPHNPRALPAKELAAKITARDVAAIVAHSIPEGVATAQKLAQKGVVCALGTLYFSADIRAAVQQSATEEK
ncbi:MAG: folylpolyglutamate synthase/dihydrofolate synthase family protein [Faecalibacterium sp.]